MFLGTIWRSTTLICTEITQLDCHDISYSIHDAQRRIHNNIGVPMRHNEIDICGFEWNDWHLLDVLPWHLDAFGDYSLFPLEWS